MPDTVDILQETLIQTQKDWGTASIMDYSRVSGHPENPGSPSIEVTGETAQDAALRFRGKKVTVLNFASGVSPGGGVRAGAMAQEEALCLSSGLLHGLENHMGYYWDNRADDAPEFCYDRMIWSEGVPLIRDGGFNPVSPMDISVITYPAPNMYRRAYAGGGQFSEERGSDGESKACFHRRCRHVVRRAEKAGTEVLILGAWGCGAYGNDPTMVAQAFRDAVTTQAGDIQKVVFAIYGVKANQKAFSEVFGVPLTSPQVGEDIIFD
jgi:uncharacterized protein (TIGR02452 family)